MAKEKMTANEYIKMKRQEVIDKIVKDIKENNTTPWRKGWQPPELSYNYKTGSKYTGINAVNLSFSEKGSQDPRWLTFVQAKDLGMEVKKGSKSESVEFFRLYDKLKKKDLDLSWYNKLSRQEKLDYEKNIQPVAQIYHVFNGKDIEGMPPYERTKESFKLDSLESKILEKSEAPIHFDGGNRAFYRPSTDSIHLPPLENFNSKGEFISTAIHEIAHSTGHESRLNRDLSGGKSALHADESYAREELVAELTTVLTMTELGLKVDQKVFDNNTAYLQSWCKHIEEDSTALYKASKDSYNATDRIKENVLGLEKQNVNEKGNEVER